MEFLMTYGWAVLVVLIVIGALASFKVLKPQQFLPAKCQLPVGLTCIDHSLSTVSENNLLIINNGLGTDIRITDIRIGSDRGVMQCTSVDDGAGAASPLPIIVGATDDYTHTFGPAAGFPINGCQIDPAARPGSRVKGLIGITYTDAGTNLQHIANGTIISDLAG